MLNQLRRLFFSFNGRIPRSTFWWTLAWLGFALIVAYAILDGIAGYASTLILYPPALWAIAALSTKRLRDRGKTPLWFLVLPVPVIGILWLFVELGLRRGSPGENQYGHDPLDDNHDYLTVN